MIEVRTTHGETHRGRSPQTIARRLYGHHVWVKLGPTINMALNGYVEATVLKRIKGDTASSVMAVWLLDQAALDAFGVHADAEEG
jgi:hypothetical protein